MSKKLHYYLFVFTFLIFQNSDIRAINSLVVADSIATFHADTTIGRKFLVPDGWKKIVIEENVTIIGSFYMPDRHHAIEIMGKSRETSIIKGDGTRPEDDGIKGRTYSGIRCSQSPDVYIHNLRSLDPMKFHISAGFGNVKVESCDLIETRGEHTTDGVHGGRNKTQVIDCYIDTHDDALYISECFLVKNCTIVNNHNGAPFQVGWGKDIGVDSCRIENCVVIDNHTGPQSRYFMGVVGWAGRNGVQQNIMNIEFVNFKRELAPGAMKAPMYQFGKGGTGIENCTINVKGYCDEEDVVEFYVSKDCDINIDCGDCTTPGGATVSTSDATCGLTDGTITFSFTDDAEKSSIFLSVDGGYNYTEVNDDLGTYTFTNIGVGDHGCWVKYANDECVTYLGNSTVNCTGSYVVPGRVEAEHYILMSGIQTEETSDVDGDLNVGWTNAGDWLDYAVNVETAGTYKVDFRVAAKNSNILIDLKKASAVLASVNTSSTGDWQSWKTVSETVELEAGEQTLRIEAKGGGWNLNWMNFTLETPATIDNNSITLGVYPIPAASTLHISTSVNEDAKYSVYTLSGAEISRGIIPQGESKIDVSTLANGMYIIQLNTSSTTASARFSVIR